MWCRLGNKQKIEGNYREPLENKNMCHSRKFSFSKDRTTRKRNAHKPKHSNIWVVA
jgi:hypothetical protein